MKITYPGWPKCTDCTDFLFLPKNCTDCTECMDNVSNCTDCTECTDNVSNCTDFKDFLVRKHNFFRFWSNKKLIFA